ncbi:hypothetical protein GCM10011608_15810 [Micromonospora sonchi]|uniref:Uncharacterized protein n=1 Tax=Micromonospora sonchi TaxID=1763543 RepID=A0A917WUV4_9ACTN|nr:hypothetical protein [Micromonospora sonchi]GGM32134.1 hypothetical protein GCM10011608_15810 [Micromonospora sonchi]
MITDATLARINQGVQLHHHQGQRAAARDLFAQIWDETGGTEARKIGDLGRAREHLQRAEAGIGALGDDEYGQLIKGGLDRLAQQLTSE